ncbi:MAG TPA: hypothetical protein GXX40_01060 [Firmicutes bacterium]|nr:hypothetical protein [Bacillota bacterium]
MTEGPSSKVLLRRGSLEAPHLGIGKRLRGYLASFDERLRNFDESRLLLLDLETTGLCGGTGTIPFLAGILVPDGARSRWQLTQYFLVTPAGEKQFLEALAPLLAGASAIVSFNGKRFDWPVLLSRYVLNKMCPPVDDPPHIDLLYPARRLWSKALQSVALQNLEERVLGFRRRFDIPSALVPSYYQMFLASRQLGVMYPVFAHNVQDIFSMLLLAMRLSESFDGEYACLSELELAGLARACKRAGMDAERLDCLRNLVERNVFEILPYVELAKYCEHKAKDYATAISLVKRALRLAPGNVELQKRLHRLQRKSESWARGASHNNH